MSAALRQVLRQVQQEAPQLARSVRTSAAPSKAPPGYHYVSATTVVIGDAIHPRGHHLLPSSVCSS